jgi:ribonuclease P protein component
MARVERLLKRADFVKCAQGRRWNTAALAVQMLANGLDDKTRLGFTVSKKNGNAVIRNRIRRRLKAAAALLPQDALLTGHDYVIVARPDALNMPFSGLQDTMTKALAGVLRPHRPKGDRSPNAGQPLRKPAAADVETP